MKSIFSRFTMSKKLMCLDVNMYLSSRIHTLVTYTRQYLSHSSSSFSTRIPCADSTVYRRKSISSNEDIGKWPPSFRQGHPPSSSFIFAIAPGEVAASNFVNHTIFAKNLKLNYKLAACDVSLLFSYSLSFSLSFYIRSEILSTSVC